MRFKIFGLMTGALLIPSISMAEFVYSGVEVSYVDVSYDAGPATIDGNGYRFSGSFELNPMTFLHGEWEDQSFDGGVDGTAYEFGAGFRHALSSSLDIIGTASYVHAEVNVAGMGFDDDGLGLGGGLRDLSGRYYFSDRYAFTLETSLDDNVDTLSFGFRAEF